MAADINQGIAKRGAMAKSSVRSTVQRGNKPDEQPNQSENEMVECAWAVCVRPQNIDDAREPKLFATKPEAEAFLVEILPEDTAAAQPEILAGDKDLEEYRRKFPEHLRDMAQLPVKQSNIIRWRRYNRDRGWHDPVPVAKVIPATAKEDPLSLRSFLPLDAVGVALPLSLDDAIERAVKSIDYIGGIGLGEYTCWLDRDWRFDEIEADARNRIGHEFEGLRHTSVVEIVVKAVYDLEDSLLFFHPTISRASRATFFRSWQLQRHIAVFCDRLSRSSTAQAISKGKEQEHAGGALEFIYQKLVVYAHTVLEGLGAVTKPEWSDWHQGTQVIKETAGRGNRESQSTANWSEIEILFVSEFTVQITRKGERAEPQNYTELGFDDRRTGKPDLNWETFRLLAQSAGTIRSGLDGPRAKKQRQGTHGAEVVVEVQGRKWKNLEKRIQRIRKVLRKRFKISADPIPYVKGTGYQTSFKIGCNQSFQT